MQNKQKVDEYDQLWNEHQKTLSELHQYKMVTNTLLRKDIGESYMQNNSLGHINRFGGGGGPPGGSAGIC